MTSTLKIDVWYITFLNIIERLGENTFLDMGKNWSGWMKITQNIITTIKDKK